jgi:hypothetical protein
MSRRTKALNVASPALITKLLGKCNGVKLFLQIHTEKLQGIKKKNPIANARGLKKQVLLI